MKKELFTNVYPKVGNANQRSKMPSKPMGLGKYILALVLLFCLGSVQSNAQVYYNKANADISSLASWGPNTDGTGTAPADFTTAGVTYRLYNSGATFSTAKTFSGTGSVLVVGDSTNSTPVTLSISAALTYGVSFRLTTNATVTVASTGSLALSGGTLIVKGYLKYQSATNMSGNSGANTAFVGSSAVFELNVNSGTVPTAGWGTGSTVYVTGATSAASGMNQDFYNITWNSTQTGNISWNWSTGRRIYGNVNIQGTGGTNQLRMGALSASGAFVWTIDGSINVSGSSTFTTNGTGTSTGTVTVNVGGNITTASGSTFAFNRGGNTATYVFNLSGNLTNAGTLTSNAAADNVTLNFSGTSAQTYTNTGTITNTLTGTKFAVSNSATLDVGTATIPANIPFTLNSGATLQTANTTGVNGSILSTTRTLNAGANYIFNGTSAQTTGALLTAANAVTINNTAGVTLSGAATISGTLTLTAGAFNLNSQVLTLSNGATIARSGGTISAAPAFGTSVNVTYAQNGTAITTGVELPTSSSILNNLTVTSTNGVVLNAATTVNGTLSLSGNLTLGNNNLTLAVANAVAGTPNASKHIVTNGTGVVTATATFSTAYTFPVGYDATNYNPVIITPSGENPTVIAKAITPTLSNVISSRAMWVIGGLTSSATNLSFPWDKNTDITGSFQAGTILHSLSGSVWSAITSSNTSGSSPNYVTTLTGLALSNPITLGVGPNSTPTLSLTSGVGTNIQSTNTLTPITNITYSWGGAATGATVTWTGTTGSNTPPAGITVNTTTSVTISGTASDAGVYGYSVSTVGGSPTVTLTGTLTIAATPTIAIADNQSIPAANILTGSSTNLLASFSIAVTDAAATINTIALPVTGGNGFVAADLSNYKLYYTTGSTFSSPTLLSTVATGLGASTITFSTLSQTIGAGATGYFWVTVDVAASAVATHTLTAGAITTSSITCSAAVTSSGASTAGGTLTFVYPTYYNVLNSDISNLNNWGINTNGSGTKPTNFTSANVTYNLYNGTSNTLGSSTAFSGLSSTLKIGDGTSAAGLSIATGNTLTIGTSANYNVATNTGLTVSANALLTINGSVVNYGAITDNTLAANFVVNGTYEVGGAPTSITNAVVPPAATWATGSNLVVTGVTGAITSGFNISPTTLPFYNVTWNCPNQSAASVFNWGSKSLLGNLTITNSNNQQIRLYGISGNVSTSIGGDFTINGANVLFSVSGSSGSGTAVVNVGGNFNLSAGSFNFNTGSSGITTPTTFNITGNLNATGGTITAGGNCLALVNTFAFAGATSHTYLNTATTVGLTNAFVSVPSGETLNLGTNTIATPYKFTLSAGATLQTTHTAGLNGNITTTGTVSLSSTANYGFNGSTAQVTGALLTNAANLTINNSAGVTLSGTTAVSGTLSLTNGAFNLNSQTLTLGNGATIARSGGSISAAPSFGTTVNVTYAQNASSITTGAEIPSSSSVLNNLNIVTTNGVSLGTSASVNGTLTLASNLTLGSNNLALAVANTVAGTLSSSCHIVTNSTGYVTSTAAFSVAFTFPIGFNGSSYNPVRITPVAETPTVRVASISPALTNSLKAMWTIGGVTATATSIDFLWVSTTDAVATAQRSGMLYSLVAGSWGTAIEGSGTTGSSPNYVTNLSGVAITNPSTFTVGQPSAAVLTLTSAVGTDAQAVNTSTSITNIVYEWSGSATTASVTWTNTANSTTPPTGITVNVDNINNEITISGKATVANNYGYTVTTDGAPSASKSGTIAVAATASTTLSAVSTVAAGNLFPGSTNNVVANFKVFASGSSATLVSVSVPFTTGGGFVAGDIVNYKLYYTTTTSFNTATPLATVTTALGTSPMVFSTFSRSIAASGTGYFWVTTDVSNTAVVGHTLTVGALSTSNLTYSLTVNKTGSVAAAGTMTISYPTYYNVANSDVSNLNNWGTTTTGGGSRPTSFTGANARFNLKNGTGNYLASSITISGAGTILTLGDSTNNAALILNNATLTIGTATASTGSLIVAPKGTLTVNTTGTLTIAVGGSLNISNATATVNVYGNLKNFGSVAATNNGVTGVLNVTGNSSVYEHAVNGGTIPLATWGTGSTLLVSGIIGTGPTFTGSTYHHVTWNCPSQTTANAGPILNNATVNGNLTISSTGTGVLRIFGMTASTNNTLTIGGNCSISGNSTVHTNGSTAKGFAIYNVSGNFTVASGSSFFFNKGGGGSTCTINMLGGDFTNAGYLSTNTAATDVAAIVFKKAGTQTFTNTATNSTTTGFQTNLASTSITVNSGTKLNISTATSIPGLVINAGGTLVNTTTLNVLYGLTNNGTISGTGTTILSGSTAQAISGNGTVNDFTINNTAGVSITSGSSNKLNVLGVLTLKAGTFTTNANLVLKSNSITNSGIINQVGTGGNTGTINGTASVERFIPKGYRAWRDVAPGVHNAGSIFNNWQMGGSYATPGYGIFITGTTASNASHGVDAANGLDQTVNSVKSAYTLTGGNWNAITNTKNTNLNPFLGYRVLVRGDRTFNLYTTPVNTVGTTGFLLMQNATILSALGNLVTGNVVFSTSGVTNTVTGSTYTNAAFGLNSNSSTGFSSVANPYVAPIDWKNIWENSRAVNLTPNYYYLDPTVGSSGAYVSYNAVADAASNGVAGTRYIQAGQAFFVENNASTAPSLTITEADKAITATKTSVFGNSVKRNLIAFNLTKQEGENWNKMDAATVVFKDQFSNGISQEDAPKMTNQGENLGLVAGNQLLCIEGRKPVTEKDELAISLTQLVAGKTYQLTIDASNFESNGLQAYLVDNTTKARTELSAGDNKVTFTVTPETQSLANRYKVVFAAKKSSVANAAAVVASSYQVYPNPLVGTQLQVQLNNIPTGDFEVKLVNSLGQQMAVRNFSHAEGQINHALQLPKLAAGVYNLVITAKDGKKVAYQTAMEIQ